MDKSILMRMSMMSRKLEENCPHFKIMVCDFDNSGVIVED